MKHTLVVHKGTHEFALARKAGNGLMLIQLNNLRLAQAYEWHLYPRNEWEVVKEVRTNKRRDRRWDCAKRNYSNRPKTNRLY